jgi:drug/metabolite transporter (DMT)-like permease
MPRTRANLLLLVAAVLWGFGNIAQKTVLVHLDPFSAVGMRCLIGGLCILPLLPLDRGVVRMTGFWLSVARVAVLFACATLVQQAAYLSTSVTNASFLVNTAAVMTPTLAWLLRLEPLNPQILCAGALTLAGAFLMCGTSGGFAGGDALALFSALCYAAWMVDLGRHMQTHGGAVRTAATQFLAAAAIALPFGAASGGLTLSAVGAAWPELMVLGVGSTALAFGLQTAAQRYTPAPHAAVIVSAEGVFGAIGAALFLGEEISQPAAAGAVLIMAAITRTAFDGKPSNAIMPNGASVPVH